MTPPLFIVTVCGPGTEHVQQCIWSVRGQTYKNWTQVVVVDGGEPVIVNEAREAIGGDKRVRVVATDERRYGLRNMVENIHRFAPHDSIVCVVDGDDILSDTSVLQVIADEYAANAKLDALWTQHVRTSGGLGNSQPLPANYSIASGLWCTSHMKTFRKQLLWAVPPDLYFDDGGKWFTAATDQALYLPLIEHARHKKFLDRVCYRYTHKHSAERSLHQQECERQIRRKLSTRYPYVTRRVALMVNGPAKGTDKRFGMGERRRPMGILLMAKHLTARGHHVDIYDRFCQHNAFPAEPSDYDTIGIYVSGPNKDDAKWCVERLRGLGFQGGILAGGPYAVYAPGEVESWGVDYASGVESDWYISQLVECGSLPCPEKRVPYLDFLPFPAYDLIADKPYVTDWPYDGTSPVFVLNTSRGCPHDCAFCDSRTFWGKQWHGQSAERICLDVDWLVRKHGARGIYFREDNFGVSAQRLRDFCDGMRTLGHGVKWACEIRADKGCDARLIADMASAGCVGLYVGVESGSQRVLDMMRKGITVEQIRQTTHNAKTSGIRVIWSLVRNFPGSTSEDEATTARLLATCAPHFCWNNPYRPPLHGGV